MVALICLLLFLHRVTALKTSVLSFLGVASVNIVSASQRPVCSVNLVNQTGGLMAQQHLQQHHGAGQNVLPGIGSLMTGASGVPSDQVTFTEEKVADSEPRTSIKPQITVLKTETTILSMVSQHSGEEKKSAKSTSSEKQEINSRSDTQSSSTAGEAVLTTIVVPYGWRRELEDGVINYYR